MLLPWRATAHPGRWAAALIALALVLPAAAHAHAGRALGSPGAALGRALDAPEAAPATALRGWSLDLTAQTSLPLSLGVEAVVESPIGLTAHLTAGHAPSAYLEAIAGILRSSGVYDESEDALVREAIGNGAWSVRAGLGFTLHEGFELAAGYTYLGGHTALSPNAIEAAIRRPVRLPGMTLVPLSVDVHALHARVGWRFVIEQHLVLRVTLGWTHTVAASARVRVRPEHDPAGGPADRMEDGIERALGSYGFTPELLLSAGYRFR